MNGLIKSYILDFISMLFHHIFFFIALVFCESHPNQVIDMNCKLVDIILNRRYPAPWASQIIIYDYSLVMRISTNNSLIKLPFSSQERDYRLWYEDMFRDFPCFFMDSELHLGSSSGLKFVGGVCAMFFMFFVAMLVSCCRTCCESCFPKQKNDNCYYDYFD
jgi:hypothetical protein